MRFSGRLIPVLAFLPVFAAAPARADVSATVTGVPVLTPKALPRFGVMADAGLPDGANASLVFRPSSWLRAHAGGGSNMISKGVRAGVTLLPFGSGPSATLEAGHYFDGDANGLARKFAGSSFQSALLERVGYDYANAHLGLDFGSRRATFYIHGGMSYVRARIHNVDSVLAAEAVANGADSGTTEVSVKQDPIVRAWFPSVKLGLIVYLW
jgi:hypothetical protein